MNKSQALWVQGWTGINHSYAMVNQYQLLELLQNDALDIYYTESAYYSGEWSRDKIGAGFSAAEAQQLSNLRAYQGEPVQATYRIHTPNTLALADAKVITFMVTEFGLDERNFAPGVDAQSIRTYTNAGNVVATPSNWSRDRIIDYGFPADSVYVVPHGVDGSRFHPMEPHARLAARTALGYTDDDVVFLNVGAPFWNKGLDIVLEAFFVTRETHKNARLLIKDQQALYGMTAVKMIQDLVAQGRVKVDAESINAISIIPKTLELEQLRDLYAVSDYYLSPYRAEGFNLPVIEAMACGTRTIVTAGGSTDDFCDDDTSIKIPSTRLDNQVLQGQRLGAFLNPDMDALLEIMSRCAQRRESEPLRMHFGRTNLLEKFTWRRAANLIAALM